MATRLQIRDRARIRADQDQSTFPTDAQYNYLIDEAAKEAWFDLVKAGWPVRPTAVPLTTAGGQYLSTGVSNAAFVQTVLRNDGGQYTELLPIQEGDRAALLSAQTNLPTCYGVAISTTGFSLELLPITSGASIVAYIVTEFPGFSADGDTWPGPARSDELVVLRSAAKAMRKEGNDQGAAQLDNEYMYVQQCVQDMASWANMRNPAIIRDVRPGLMPIRMPGDYDI